MLRKVLAVQLVFLSVLVFSSPCWAAGFFGPDPDKAPSILRYGLRGFGIGTILGTSTGYLIGHSSDPWNGDDWKNLGVAMGVGAIAGTFGGLGVGFYDLSLEKPGVGSIVLRDTLWGAGLGGLGGAVAGGLFILHSGQSRDVALGASVGSLVGAAAGVVIGFIEGPRIVERYSGGSRAQADGEPPVAMPTWRFGVDVRKEPNGHAYIPTLAWNF